MAPPPPSQPISPPRPQSRAPAGRFCGHAHLLHQVLDHGQAARGARQVQQRQRRGHRRRARRRDGLRGEALHAAQRRSLAHGRHHLTQGRSGQERGQSSEPQPSVPPAGMPPACRTRSPSCEAQKTQNGASANPHAAACSQAATHRYTRRQAPHLEHAVRWDARRVEQHEAGRRGARVLVHGQRVGLERAQQRQQRRLLPALQVQDRGQDRSRKVSRTAASAAPPSARPAITQDAPGSKSRSQHSSVSSAAFCPPCEAHQEGRPSRFSGTRSQQRQQHRSVARPARNMSRGPSLAWRPRRCSALPRLLAPHAGAPSLHTSHRAWPR